MRTTKIYFTKPVTGADIIHFIGIENFIMDLVEIDGFKMCGNDLMVTIQDNN